MRRFLLSLLFVAACSDAPSEAPTDAGADLGTADVADMAADAEFVPSGPFADCAPFSALGPNPVGVRSATIAGHETAVFYPAVAAGDAYDQYDLRDWLPPEDAALISDAMSPPFEFPAYRDAAPAAGPYPVVLFSHGFGGYRLQSSVLLSTIASWGFIVVAPEHPERNLTRFLELDTAPMEDFSAVTLVEVLDGLPQDAGDLAAAMNVEKVAMLGHSAGGAATLSAGGDERVSVAIAWATGGLTESDPIETPTVHVAGGNDRLSNTGSVKGIFNDANSPKQFAIVDGLGHLGFADICLIGREDGGILKIAEDAGVDVPALLRVLASDGCLPQDRPPEEGWPLVNEITMRSLDHRLRDGEPLDPAATEACFGELYVEIIDE